MIRISCSLLLIVSALAQPPDTLWTRTYGGALSDDSATAVVLTDDGGFVLAANGEFSILKSDSNGNVVWTAQVPATLSDIERTEGGGFVVAGSASDSGNFASHFYLARLDESGSLLWSRMYGDSLLIAGAEAVAVTPDGGFVLVGTTVNEYMWSNVLVVATDSNGDTLWTARSGGMFDDEGGHDVQVDGNEIIYVAGHTNPYPSGHYMYGSRSTVDGQSLGGIMYTWSDSWSRANAVAVRPDGSYLLAGYQYTPWDPQTTLYVAEISPSDVFVRPFTAGGLAFDEAFDVKLFPDGGCLAAGYSDSFEGFGTMYLVKFGVDGEVEWQKTVGNTGGEIAYGLAVYPNGEILAVGVAVRPDGSNTDAYVVKLAAPAVGEDPLIPHPTSFILSAYPNPFNSKTTIRFNLPHSQDIELNVYNVLGERIETLTSGRHEAGEHAVMWQASGASGIYFIRLSGAEVNQTQKIMLLR